MTAADCYRILELRMNASFQEVKAGYRRLARLHHPDVNPGDRHAQEKFIEITAAYKFLVAAQTSTPQPAVPPPAPSRSPKITVTRSAGPPPTAAPRQAPAVQVNSAFSPFEHQLKVSSYEQLQQFLKLGRFPRAIALVEALAQRLPQDPEIAQWQAIAYQRWARQLISDRQVHKARLYLKKALSTDPHNRTLWAEIEKDFQRLERLL